MYITPFICFIKFDSELQTHLYINIDSIYGNTGLFVAYVHEFIPAITNLLLVKNNPFFSSHSINVKIFDD